MEGQMKMTSVQHTRFVRALLLGLVCLGGLAPQLASAQTPANCNANLLDESISAVPTTAGAGDTVNYLVIVTDRSVLPPGCTPGAPGCQVGCNVLNVTADFCCPNAAGDPAIPPPNALCTNLVTDVDIAANDAFAVFGPFPCIMPNVVGGATAAVVGNGFLDDGFDSPFDIFKTIAVAITTTTTTTSTSTTTTSTSTSTTSSTTTTTSSTTSTTAPPPLCLTRTPGFWGNHPFLIASDDPRSLDLLPLDVCGTTLDNVDTGSDSSTTEAICSVGTDSKILGPQITQLVRQCTAALLNVATSTELGGSCEGAFPNLSDLLNACCDESSLCTGVPQSGFTLGSCITQVDAFNGTELDTVSFGFNPGPADAGPCRASKGNKVVVTPTP
jgi:hypothetical protein